MENMPVAETPSTDPVHGISASADDATTPTPSLAVAPKLKRFRFSESADLLLLKCVSSCSAHIASWGKKGTLFEQVYKQFMTGASDALLTGKESPSQKSLEDRFKTIASKRREAVKKNAAASGIVEAYGERETLLDDLILEMDEKAEEDREERNEKTEREKKLLEAGERIRNAALRRGGSGGQSVNDVIGESPHASSRQSPSGSSKYRRQQRAINSADSDDEATEILRRDMELRREAEKRRLDIDEKRFDLEEKRVRLDEVRFKETQDAVNRRLDLDEKKAAVEIEERKQAMEERGKMIDVLAALASKIAK